MEKRANTLLVAEDQSSIRNLMGSILEGAGYRVVLARDGAEAVRLYNQNDSVTCVISDILMPGMDGREFAKYNFENKLLPFIVCTSMTDAKIAIDLIRSGVQDYVVKPFTPEQLLGVVSVVVNKRKGERACTCVRGGHPWQVGTISFLSSREELQSANEWIAGKLQAVFEKKELRRFVNFISEFLLNALEHGNFNIGEQEKQKLIERGVFEEELARRERESSKVIRVVLSENKNEVAVKISDEGMGFNYKKYLDMNEETLIGRMGMPNGRGIYLGRHYFDTIAYEDGGASVIIIKKIGKKSTT